MPDISIQSPDLRADDIVTALRAGDVVTITEPMVPLALAAPAVTGQIRDLRNEGVAVYLYDGPRQEGQPGRIVGAIHPGTIVLAIVRGGETIYTREDHDA